MNDMVRFGALSFFFLLNISVLQAQPKYEFRAVWVATVANIDWPSEKGLSVEKQKKEAVAILEKFKDLGMNAIVLQVRPAADAFYKSELEPWSLYLMGKQGQRPEPCYDPLQFWVGECHKRGMELHVWLNPYRVAQNANEPLSVSHIAFKHPEWILQYGKKLYFDPGIPGVRTFIAKVVKDIVSRYNVDAIHMDDYFYPYPLKQAFPDTASFRMHNRGFSSENIAEWRRENVDMTIKMLNDTIKSVKPWVKFGISPFGVWRNIADDPEGSETKAGITNYDNLYADILKWQKKGWIDYCVPQLYWRIGHPLVDFTTLANWWATHAYGRDMYVGQAAYRVEANSKKPEWQQPNQLPRQVEILRSIPGLEGSVFFSSRSFNNDLLGFRDSLKNDLYRHPAIVPPMAWLDSIPPAPVKKVRKYGKRIRWKTVDAQSEFDKPWQFVVYMNEAGQKFNPEDSRFILALLKGKQIKFRRINRKKRVYELRVSVLDRMNNESSLSAPLKIKL